MEKDEVRELIAEMMAEGLRAQIRVLQRLKPPRRENDPPRRRGLPSNQTMAHQVLLEAGHPLHVREIVARIRERYGAPVRSHSLSSVLHQRASCGEQFTRTEPSTFGLLGRDK